MAGFGSAITLAWPVIANARHGAERSLIAQGDRQRGLAALAWYQAAHDLAPRDPSPGIKLAQRLWQQGSGEAAVNVLAPYKAPEAAVLRGQYLVRLERFDDAERVLRPLEGGSGPGEWPGKWPEARNWMAVALAEQGKVQEAATTMEPPGVEILAYRESPLGLLQEELRLHSPYHDPGQLSPEGIADGYAKWGMIRSAQRVLADNHVTSASSWMLRGKLDQAVVKVNWQTVESDYQQALAADPSSAEVRAALRQVAQHNGDKAQLQNLDELEKLLPVS